MTKYLIFPLFLIINTLSFSQFKEIKEIQYQLIYKDSLITEDRVGGIRIGDDLIKLIDNYDFIEDYNEYYLKINNKLILSVWSKDEKSISGITVYSCDFITKNELHVGSGINDILELYPSLKINLSEESGEEYFSIGDFFDKNENKFIFYLISNSREKLGRYNPSDFYPDSNDFNKDGEITKIVIFD